MKSELKNCAFLLFSNTVKEILKSIFARRDRMIRRSRTWGHLDSRASRYYILISSSIGKCRSDYHVSTKRALTLVSNGKQQPRAFLLAYLDVSLPPLHLSRSHFLSNDTPQFLANSPEATCTLFKRPIRRFCVQRKEKFAELAKKRNSRLN